MNIFSLTPFGLFESAGLVGRAVMILLGLASVWCWVLIIEGALSLRRLGKALRNFETRPAQPAALFAPVVGADPLRHTEVTGRGRIGIAFDGMPSTSFGRGHLRSVP